MYNNDCDNQIFGVRREFGREMDSNGGSCSGAGDAPSSTNMVEFSTVNKVLREKLWKTNDKTLIMQKDPSTPLYSAISFVDLKIPQELLRGIYDMGYCKPSRIQEKALPILLREPKTNLIGQSQSGTGKTAAFMLASLYRVKPELDELQVVILAPTFELALQISQVAKQMAKYKPEIRIRGALRGEMFERRTSNFSTDHVLIGTPGKLLNWCLKQRFYNLSTVSVFVFDEADVMLDQFDGMGEQSNKLREYVPPTCQLMLFSATFSKSVMDFVAQNIPNPYRLELDVEELTLENINQYYIEVSNPYEKYNALANIFGTISMGQAFIFCDRKLSALELAQQLGQDGHRVGLISGDLSIEQRNEAIQRFRDGQERVMIATNVMARGIDIEQVTIVINYSIPVHHETREVDCETYLHRIGRTGRFGKEGLAINFVDGPNSLHMIKMLEQHFGKPIKKLDATDVDEIEMIGNDM